MTLPLSTQFFNDSSLLSNLIFPWLDAHSLSRVAPVNKKSSEASKVELLWEQLCTSSHFTTDVFSPPGTWKKNFILQYNLNHGIYRELPVRTFKTTYDLFDAGYTILSRVISVQPEGIKISLLGNNTELFIKAPGFQETPNFLKHLEISTYYTILKTNKEIQVYSNETGNLFRTFALENANWEEKSLTCNKHILASIDNHGTKLKVWDLQKGELIWEETIPLPPGELRTTTWFTFIDNLKIYWVRDSVDIWILDIANKTATPTQLENVVDQSSTAGKRKECFKARLEKNKNNKGAFPNEGESLAQLFKMHFINNTGAFLVWSIGERSYSTFNKNLCATSVDLWVDNKKKLSVMRLWNCEKLNSIFLKKIDGYSIKKIAFTHGKIYLALKKFDDHSQKIEIRTLNFHPECDPTKHHPDHIKEEYLSTQQLPPPVPAKLSLFQRLLALVKRLFASIQATFAKILARVR